MESSQGRQRLTKVKLRTLSALLQRDRESLTTEERMDAAQMCQKQLEGALLHPERPERETS